MFLTMLANLDSKDLLRPDSEVKNLGLVMGLYVLLAKHWRGMSALPDHWPTLPIDRNVALFDLQTSIYARLAGIEMVVPGAVNMEYLRAQTESFAADEPALPVNREAKDPWMWSRTLTRYGRDFGRPKIGGDSCDITTWTSAKRKQASFDHKDPISAKHLKALREGMVMQLG
jgi:hypothetical protein